jgi:hypothetical protein
LFARTGNIRAMGCGSYGGMENWLKIPDRRRSMPIWRLCALMGVSFLILWIGSPVVFSYVLGPLNGGN